MSWHQPICRGAFSRGISAPALRQGVRAQNSGQEVGAGRPKGKRYSDNQLGNFKVETSLGFQKIARKCFPLLGKRASASVRFDPHATEIDHLLGVMDGGGFVRGALRETNTSTIQEKRTQTQFKSDCHKIHNGPGVRFGGGNEDTGAAYLGLPGWRSGPRWWNCSGTEGSVKGVGCGSSPFCFRFGPKTGYA